MRVVVRVIAVLLVLGGLLGVLAYVMMALAARRAHHDWTLIAALVSIVLFSWTVVTGVALWRRVPGAYRWTKVILALQIPTFSVSHFAYEFSVFVSLRLMIGNTTHNVGGNVGSSNTLLYSSQPLGWMVGINLVAVLGLWYLMRSTRRLARSA